MIFGFFKLNDPAGFFLLLLASEKSGGEFGDSNCGGTLRGAAEQNLRRCEALWDRGDTTHYHVDAARWDMN